MNRGFFGMVRVCTATIMIMACLQVSCTPQVDLTSSEDQSSNDDLSTIEIAANGRPVGWTDDTHGKDATPNYETVLTQGTVKRIDITISSSNWQLMLDDMTNMYGQFGQSGGGLPGNGGGGDGNFSPPTDMTDVCNGLQEGDACTVSFNGMTTQGTCAATMDGQLACQMDSLVPPDGQNRNPEDDNISPPTEMIAACNELQEGDTCTASINGTAVQGTCTATTDGQLACTSQTGVDMNNGGMLGDNGTNPVVVPCTLVFEDKTWWYVGIRFKGNSSLMSTWSSGIYKLPFRLDFDAFEEEHPEVDNQRFFGFKELSLASNWSDSTYLREKVTHDVFREAGVPAPHTAFYRLYIDYGEGPTYFGLYTMTEIPDNPMFQTQFGDDNGNLYKPTSNWVTFNQDDFEKQSNKDEADWSDIEAAIAALHADRSDPVTWRTGLEATFNVDGFLRWLAVNTVIQNWDTYGLMAHNYYLYGNPVDEGRLNWIPWDNNMAFMSGMGGGMNGQDNALSLGLTEVGEQWPLIRYLMDDQVYRSAYISYMKEFIDGAFDVSAVQARFQTAHDLIAPYVTGSEGEQTGYTLLSNQEDFDTGLTELLQFVADRADAAKAFLDGEQ